MHPPASIHTSCIAWRFDVLAWRKLAATKDGCEKCGLMISKALPTLHGTYPQPLVEARAVLLASLKRTPGGLDQTLAALIMHGIGYHHSGAPDTSIKVLLLYHRVYHQEISSCPSDLLEVWVIIYHQGISGLR
eukprot:SAG11_NODE_12955_length_677_cov_0.984429_2_plen_133_part_00